MATDRNFKKLGANLQELEIAWQDRLTDAKALMASGRHASAIAMSIYALEILLKTLICKKLDLQQLLAAFEIHELDGLLILSGLERQLTVIEKKQPVKLNWDSILDASKQINDLRYKPDKLWTKDQAEQLLEQLEDPQNGVIQWLSKQP